MLSLSTNMPPKSEGGNQLTVPRRSKWEEVQLRKWRQAIYTCNIPTLMWVVDVAKRLRGTHLVQMRTHKCCYTFILDTSIVKMYIIIHEENMKACGTLKMALSRKVGLNCFGKWISNYMTWEGIYELNVRPHGELDPSSIPGACFRGNVYYVGRGAIMLVNIVEDYSHASIVVTPKLHTPTPSWIPYVKGSFGALLLNNY